MRLSFSTNAFTRFTLVEALEMIASTGYQGVEILADIPHLYVAEPQPAVLAALKSRLNRLDLQVASINANTTAGYYGRSFWEPLFEPSLANPDDEARKWRINYTLNCMHSAAALGSSTVSITSGRPVPGVRPEQALAVFMDSVHILLDAAEKLKVRLAIEYEPGLLIENYRELASFLAQVDSPRLGANLDVGHVHVAGDDPDTTIKNLGSAIFHVHLDDILARKHYHLIPGEGGLDFRAILAALQDIHYTGFITVELYTYPDQPLAAAQQAYVYLGNLLEEL